MRAIILATSETNKLHPLTESIPSPLLPVAGRPVMVYPLELLARQEYKQITISLYNGAAAIEACFGSGSRWGLQLEYVLQPNAWGTAGSLKWARQSLTDTFVVLPGDHIANFDLKAVVAEHQAKKSIATVVSFCGSSRPERGQLYGSGRFARERQLISDLVYSEEDVYIFEPQVLDFIPPRTPFDISTQLIPALLENGLPVNQSIAWGYWNPLNTFIDYQDAQIAVLRSALKKQPPLEREHPVPFPHIEGHQYQEGIWVGQNTFIHPLARLTPPLIIGENCSIGKEAEIGPETVIGKNVIIDDEASVTYSTILDDTYVGRLVNLDRRVVAKNLMMDISGGESVYMTEEHLLTGIDQRYEESSLFRFFNRLMALLLILFTSPVMTVIALLLVIQGGPVFTTHACRHHAPDAAEGKPYHLLRFRTTGPKGQRTRLGRWISQRGLHRLPELFNVLMGDVRLVGVKPLTEEENHRVTEDWQRTRYAVPPGIMGLWYVQTAADSDFDEVMVSDAYYAVTHTFWGDLKLIFQSLLTWVRRF